MSVGKAKPPTLYRICTARFVAGQIDQVILLLSFSRLSPDLIKSVSRRFIGVVSTDDIINLIGNPCYPDYLKVDGTRRMTIMRNLFDSSRSGHFGISYLEWAVDCKKKNEVTRNCIWAAYEANLWGQLSGCLPAH